jgi:hypothetical protein
MTKISWLLPFVLVGCVIVEEGPPPGSSSPPPNADSLEQQFDDTVQPLLEANCDMCHGQPGFAVPALDYATITTTPALNGGATPEASRLLTKGNHEGPGRTAAEASAVLAWLEAEAAAGD